MKTLLERLKPQYVAKLTAAADKYPIGVESMIKRLTELYYIHDLTIHDATVLVNYCDCDVAGIYNMFYTINNEDGD